MSVLHVLGHVECSATIGIDVTIKDAQLFFVLRLEVYHLLERDGICPAAAMQPKLVYGPLVDTFRLAFRVRVEFQSHILSLGHELKLSAKVRDASWLQFQNFVKEGRAITCTLIETTFAHGGSGQKYVRCFDNRFNKAIRHA